MTQDLHQRWQRGQSPFDGLTLSPAGKDLDFYLRFYIPRDYDNDYPERRGDFDVTCRAELAKDLAAALQTRTDLAVVCRPAKEFFDSSYGG